MARRSYTILVLSDVTFRARRFHLTQKWLRAALLSGTLALLTLSYFAYRYVSFHLDYRELELLRQAVQAQEVLVGKMKALEREVGRLRELDTQIRVLAGMEKGKGEETAVAVGGGALELQKALKEGLSAEKERLLERMYQDLRRLEREVALREQSFKALTDYLKRQKDRLAATPSIWPTRGFVTSKYGRRKSPFTGRRQFHAGIDIAAPPGTSIVAPADGVVSYAGKLAGYGRAIVIDHGFGLKTFYGHNRRNKVKRGQRVKRGQVIGYVGSSGYSTGSHLHYEVLVKGAPVDPLKYILDEERRAEIIRRK